ncbi:MAG TPA: hypothetical protein VFV86_08150 [Nitrososphaeraceae archaeon]|nr:hypothetical protein [Nitrososphaeraceae archaeon]
MKIIKKLKYDEILLKLQKICRGVEDFAYNDFGKYIKNEEFYQYGVDKKHESNEVMYLEGIGICIEIDEYGGEGKGEEWYSVKWFPEHDIYIKVEGFYQSYHGTEFYEGWDCCSNVKPKTRTITVYE